MWRVGFFFHEMAFGLLSIFLPLYVVSIGGPGSLIYVGLMTSSATLLATPASFFWGYICDKTGKYKFCILISFLTSSALLYFFTFTNDIRWLIILYGAMAVFHMAHEPPKNVLIAELYTRGEWEKSFAVYEWFTEMGWLTGLILGVFISLAGFNSRATFLICSSLNLLAFVLSLFFVSDPPLIIERGLVRIEKSVDFTFKGAIIALKALDGLRVSKSLAEENLAIFCGGLVLFTFAASMLFTPLPIFLAQNLRLATSMVYALYVLNSSASAIGYFFVSRNVAEALDGRKRLQKVVLFRSGLVFLLATFTIIDVQKTVVVASVLALMGFTYAVYHVYALSLSMELIPAGKAGLFDALTGLGSALGAYLGPFIAQAFSFAYVFTFSGAMFLLAYVFFKAS